MNIGWLDDITNWLREQFEKLFNFLVQLVKDAILWLFEALFQLVTWIVEAIPVPAFMEGATIASLLASAGPVIAWCISTFKIGECMIVIAGAYAFRLLRKLLTLGQW